MYRKIISFIISIFITTITFAQIAKEFSIKAKGANTMQVIYSPDGEKLIICNKNKINIYNDGTFTIKGRIKSSHKIIKKIFFLNKNHVAILGVNKFRQFSSYIEIVELENLRTIKTIKSELINSMVNAEALDYQGNIIVQSSNGDLYIIKSVFEKETVEPFFKDKISQVSAFNCDKKNQIIYYSDTKGKLFVFNYLKSSLDTTVSISANKLNRIVISITGKFLAVSDIKGKIIILSKEKNFSSLELSRKHKGMIFSMNFSSDEKYLSTSDEKSIHIWDFLKNSIVFSQRSNKSGPITSSCFDPKGNYFGYTSFKSSRIGFWNCKGLNITPYIDIKNEKDKTPPQILITFPNITGDKVTVGVSEIEIKGMAIDENGLFNLALNGNKVSTTSSGEFKIELKLSIGDNPIIIEAQDLNNNISLKKINIIRRDFDAADYNFSSKNILFAIGVDKYTSWPELNNATSDAQNLKNTLLNYYNFSEENIIDIYDTLASKKRIIDAFKQLIEKTKANDNVIIYFSGHGYFDPVLGEGYWIPYNAQKGNEGDYLPNSFILQLIRKLEAKHVVLLADACFSGSLFNENSRGYNENVSQYKSRWGLTSGRLELVSDGSKGTQSPFNKYLVKFLVEAKETEFPFSDLVQYVKKNVANESDQIPVGNPLKNVGDEGGELIFHKVIKK
jgi:hypothetical protein